MSEFQLILLSERERAVRTAQPDLACSIISFKRRDDVWMPSFAVLRAGLSADELASWWTPIQACAYAARCVSSPEAAAKAVWQLLLGGMIEAVASSASMTPERREPIITNEATFIPREYWNSFSDSGSDLWDGDYGRFWLIKGHQDRPATYLAYGIKLNPDDVRGHLPPPNPIYEAEIAARRAAKLAKPEPPTARLETTSKGGRPRKDFWDDLWIEVCAHVHEEGIPRKQAEIENLMLDWAAEHGHEVSVTSVRSRARKLLHRLQNPRTKT